MRARVERGSNIALTLALAKKLMREAGIASWALDSDLLMMEAVGFSRVELVTKGDRAMTDTEFENFSDMLGRRLDNEPIQYILNRCEFMGLEFYVDHNVLIPRGDTECCVETALEYLREKEEASVLDLCTGSGCIAVSTACYGKSVSDIWAVDINAGALETAKKNALKNNVPDKIKFIKGNMLEAVKHIQFDMIISNPPYIETAEIDRLQCNVKEHEPYNALDGGTDGLDFYRIIAEDANAVLKDGGLIVLEIGYNQETAVKDIFVSKGYRHLESRKDLAGLDRVMVFSK